MTLACTALASRARADGLEGVSLFPATGTFRAGAELESAAFRVEGKRGSFMSLIGRLEYTPMKDLGLRVRVPYDSLSLQDEPATREGLADTELRLRAHLKTSEPLRISAGWVTQLPTGSRSDGLGAGAVQVMPFVNAGLRKDRLILYVIIADAYSLGSRRLPAVNYVDPGANHELRTTLGSIYMVAEAVSTGIVFTQTTVLTNKDLFDSLLVGSFQVGAQPDKRLRLVIAQSLPLLGEQRFSWKLNAAATYSF